ncbi:hypothetical protein ES703_40396 [subsurface metagenome]
MFKERKRSLRKNMVFLVCVAFIFMVFPEVTQAAAKPSSERFPFPKESTLLIPAIFSFGGLNLYPPGYDIAFFYSLSSNGPKLPKQAKNGNGEKNGQKPNSSFNSNGNSTSQKKPKSKDDD